MLNLVHSCVVSKYIIRYSIIYLNPSCWRRYVSLFLSLSSSEKKFLSYLGMFDYLYICRIFPDSRMNLHSYAIFYTLKKYVNYLLKIIWEC